MARGVYVARLREMRERRALTQMQLADLSGLSQHTISVLERGERPAQAGTRQKLARALDCDPADLVDWPALRRYVEERGREERRE